MTFPTDRPRRLRRTPALRRMVEETRLHPADFVLPLFVKEGIAEPQDVASMPGVQQHTLDSLRKVAAEAVDAGVAGVILFGVPADKDATGTQADADDGIVQRALRALSSDLGDSTVLMADLCLCEYTDHGHCGALTADRSTVDNDVTLMRYASIARAQVEAGADVVAPSGMMDGQVGVIRDAIDSAGYADRAILAYSAKYASAFYGPFRDAAESTPSFGDRRAYQMDPANGDEALREVFADLDQGADAVMVKPAGPYLDIIARVRAAVDVPVAAYQISGEYAMLEAAASNGWIDRDRAIIESVTAIKRAGASPVITYWATELAHHLR
ncbi:MAG TPA: porphobilinogen synthase [Actinomycetes bacterium]|nr:porphobilinogen synthase [Actinomycetes bacterium]